MPAALLTQTLMQIKTGQIVVRKTIIKLLAILKSSQFHINEAIGVLVVSELDCVRLPLSHDELLELVRLYNVVEVNSSPVLHQ